MQKGSQSSRWHLAFERLPLSNSYFLSFSTKCQYILSTSHNLKSKHMPEERKIIYQWLTSKFYMRKKDDVNMMFILRTKGYYFVHFRKMFCFIYKVSGRISVTQLALSSRASYVGNVYQISVVAKLADENFVVPFRFF